MKWRGLSLVLAAFAICSLARGADAQSSEIRVVVGTVEIGSGEPPVWRAAIVGDILHGGDIVRTAAGGRAELATAAGTVRLYEGSILRIPAGTDSAIDLDLGSSIFDIRKRIHGQPFEVHTPHAVVMVKGTRFTVSVDEHSAAVDVSHGLVGVRGLGAGNHEVLVHPGFRAQGGSGHSFELSVFDLSQDRWEAWERGASAARPEAPSARSTELRAAVQASVRRDLALSVPAAPQGGPIPTGTPVEGPDAAVNSASVIEMAKSSFAETQLGGGTTGTSSFDIAVLKSGGPNRVQITGPGLIQTLDKDQLEQVIGGNTGPLGAPLSSLLTTQGIDPGAFAAQLLDLL